MANRDQLYNDPEEALRIAFDGRLSVLWTSFPGLVTEVDLDKMTCSVQPAIQGSVEDDTGAVTFVNLPLLVDVPIQFPKGGNFALTFPVAVDDEVLVIIASRCIDAWWQSGGIQKPMEARMHDLSDGFAIPGISSQPNVISSIKTDAVQLRNLDGTSFFEISTDGKVKATSSTEVDITAPTVKITGNLDVTGNITATEVTAGTTPLHTHVHSGVTSGMNNSGPPVP